MQAQELGVNVIYNFKPRTEFMEKQWCDFLNITMKKLQKSDSTFNLWSIDHNQKVPNYDTSSQKINSSPLDLRIGRDGILTSSWWLIKS